MVRARDNSWGHPGDDTEVVVVMTKLHACLSTYHITFDKTSYIHPPIYHESNHSNDNHCCRPLIIITTIVNVILDYRLLRN